MTNKCELCKNKEICKYRKEYEARFKELAELDESKIRENPTFSIDLDCKYYEKEKQLSTQEIEQLLGGGCLRLDSKPVSILDNITLTGKPTGCDYAYPCSECEKASYCADRYLAKEEK